MTISNDLIEQAIDHISDIQGIQMNPDGLVDDIVLVAYVFNDEELFKKAINQIIRSFHLIIEKRSIGEPLVGNLSGWYSFHFQSQRVNKQPADMRCVYQDPGGTDIKILGFGHRHLPKEIYRRLYNR